MQAAPLDRLVRLTAALTALLEATAWSPDEHACESDASCDSGAVTRVMPELRAAAAGIDTSEDRRLVDEAGIQLNRAGNAKRFPWPEPSADFGWSLSRRVGAIESVAELVCHSERIGGVDVEHGSARCRSANLAPASTDASGSESPSTQNVG